MPSLLFYKPPLRNWCTILIFLRGTLHSSRCNKSIWCFVCLFTNLAGYRIDGSFKSSSLLFSKQVESGKFNVVSQSTNMFILLYGIWTHSKIEHAQKANRTCCLEHITKTAFHTHKGSNLLYLTKTLIWVHSLIRS